jgi:hypothetical protein
MSDTDLAFVHFALGKIYDDGRLYTQAFFHFQEANRLKALSCHFSRAEFSDCISQIVEAFPRELFASAQAIGHTSELPIFIVGLPRSGTTLVEQIIASHPSVGGGDELDYIDQIVSRLNAFREPRSTFPTNIAEANASTLNDLAAEYVHALQSLAPAATRISDKGLNNFLYLGLIALILPRSRVIHCQRDKRDVCLSNYFQNYAKDLSFSYRLSDLAFYCAEYERLWSHWRDVIPLPIHTLDYESLVGDLQGVARELVAYCGLPWSDSCLSFHRSDRRVKTASKWQVRQPIYSTSVQRWRHYEAQLGPFLSELGE